MLSLKGAGSGRLPGLPCPQSAKSMRPGIVPVTGNSGLQCGASANLAGLLQTGLVLLALGYGCPCDMPFVNRLFQANQVCV